MTSLARSRVIISSHTPYLIACCALILGLATLLYGQLLRNWAQQCWTDPSFSYALLVPFIIVYLAQMKLTGPNGASIRASVSTDWLGYFVVLAGCALLLIGQVAAITVIARLSLVVVLLGLSIGLFGRRLTRAMLFPFGLLLLAIPWPALIYLPFAFRLQLVSSALAGHALDLFGIPALREGNVITLPDVSLQVVEACSGVHSLFALFTVAVLAGYLLLKNTAGRLLLTVVAPPLAIALNAARVTLLGIVSYSVGPESAEGFAHFSTGLVLFALGCGAILVLGYRLSQREAGKPRHKPDHLSSARAPTPSMEPRSLVLNTIALAAILLATARLGSVITRPDRVQLIRRPWTAFPMELAGWHGRDVQIPQQQLEALGTDSVLARDYFDSGSLIPVGLYVAFFPAQREGATMHSPLHCIPGAGWETESRRILPIAGDFCENLRVNEVVFRKQGERALTLYWYMEQGRPERSELIGAMRTLWNGMMNRRSDGCLIRFFSPLIGSEEATRARELNLLDRVVPILTRDFLPPASEPSRATTRLR